MQAGCVTSDRGRDFEQHCPTIVIQTTTVLCAIAGNDTICQRKCPSLDEDTSAIILTATGKSDTCDLNSSLLQDVKYAVIGVGVLYDGRDPAVCHLHDH